ncbi:hypothetical protein K8089_10895 [Aequorivita sp. F47161]|uniref:Uncharacterized protein n=1 Tax=Aequorivita vitellina TaxID=2874475 RepID=A0A9X1QU58_9FLAO|nr:hypothetical protein [Aequorivita vitellina]MCG2419531.1 hypothetical protein [Aequorivita vitellina]
MKKKKRKIVAFEKIKNELSTRNELLRPAGFSCNAKPMMKGEFSIGDNDELLFNISCLLKTCVLALDGDATFTLSAISNSDPKSDIIVALEFIINLLPREQMVSLDEITKILAEVESN